MQFIKRFLSDQRGVAGVELGLILGLIVIGIVGGLSNLGQAVQSSYQDTAQKVANAS